MHRTPVDRPPTRRRRARGPPADHSASPTRRAGLRPRAPPPGRQRRSAETPSLKSIRRHRGAPSRSARSARVQNGGRGPSSLAAARRSISVSVAATASTAARRAVASPERSSAAVRRARSTIAASAGAAGWPARASSNAAAAAWSSNSSSVSSARQVANAAVSAARACFELLPAGGFARQHRLDACGRVALVTASSLSLSGGALRVAQQLAVAVQDVAPIGSQIAQQRTPGLGAQRTRAQLLGQRLGAPRKPRSRSERNREVKLGRRTFAPLRGRRLRGDQLCLERARANGGGVGLLARRGRRPRLRRGVLAKLLDLRHGRPRLRS